MWPDFAVPLRELLAPGYFLSAGVSAAMLDQFAGDADVEHVQAADVLGSRRGQKSNLGGDERARLGRAKGVQRRLARVTIQPAGQVHRQLRRGSRVQFVDYRVEWRPGFAAPPVPNRLSTIHAASSSTSLSRRRSTSNERPPKTSIGTSVLHRM